ncbi:phage protease [Deinococcus cellulosilyticus]|uniref:Uncharacterized protein n=1 Tax=Deinococcus cellulosilyticus (strain DSM 18568 / NBRC 106333 / KACC 11606 / 5516J-15) TaxID=1223518 RepID=A0A511MW65_DEIC1|nr:phage protease [Deinococcus cellulosilyticus]GEM44822.1 hypothetical protein DC3_04570 [Deinococcus cellulosilyticus NBRC 106333 = KACC 11606]
MQRRTALSVIPVGNTPPTEIRMFAYGETDTNKGPFYLTPEGAQRIVSYWQEQGNDLSADYEHGMLQAIQNTGTAVPSAAAFRLEAREDGLYAVDIRWTEKAAGHIEAGEYRYFSPLFLFEPDTREITTFYNFALVNIPAIKNQSPLVALSMSISDLHSLIGSALRKQFTSRLSITEIFTDYVIFELWTQEDTWKTFRVGYHLVGDQVEFDETAEEARKAYLPVPNGENMKRILTALSALTPALAMGQTTFATEDDALKGIAALSGFATKVQDLTGAPTLEAGLGVLSAWQQSHERVGALSAQVESLQAAEKARIIHQAIHVDHKLSPAQKEWAEKQSMEALSAFLATAPKIVGGNHTDEVQPHGNLTVEQFMALSGLEKAAIYQENPDKYTELVALSKQRKA